MSWAFSIGDFLIADPTTEIPARAQEERKVELRPQNGPRLSEQHLPPINKEKRKEREREREREELDWQRRWLRSRSLALSPPNYRRSHLPEDRRAALAAWDWILIMITAARSRVRVSPCQSRLIGRSLPGWPNQPCSMRARRPECR